MAILVLYSRAKINIPNIRIGSKQFCNSKHQSCYLIIVKMAGTSNEESLSVSTTATTLDTGLEMY